MITTYILHDYIMRIIYYFDFLLYLIKLMITNSCYFVHRTNFHEGKLVDEFWWITLIFVNIPSKPHQGVLSALIQYYGQMDTLKRARRLFFQSFDSRKLFSRSLVCKIRFSLRGIKVMNSWWVPRNSFNSFLSDWLSTPIPSNFWAYVSGRFATYLHFLHVFLLLTLSLCFLDLNKS